MEVFVYKRQNNLCLFSFCHSIYMSYIYMYMCVYRTFILSPNHMYVYADWSMSARIYIFATRKLMFPNCTTYTLRDVRPGAHSSEEEERAANNTNKGGCVQCSAVLNVRALLVQWVFGSVSQPIHVKPYAFRLQAAHIISSTSCP